MQAPYLDASAIIYLVEGTPDVRGAVASLVAEAEQHAGRRIITSRLSCLECRVKPLRDQDLALVETYDRFFSRPGLTVFEVTRAVIDRATELRARLGFKTPDAIHLASAIEASVDLFITGDRAVARCTDLNVRVVSRSSPPP